MTSFFKRPEIVATALVLTAIGAVAARTHRAGAGELGKGSETTRGAVSFRGADPSMKASDVPLLQPGLSTEVSRAEINSVPACCRPPVRNAAPAAPVVQQPTKASKRPEPRASLITATKVPAAPRFQSVDPFAPGNALPVPGGSLIVQASRQNPNSATPELDLKFSPIALTPSNKETASDTAVKTTPEPQSSAAAVNRPGLTYEQELFRTKWGWVAFDQAQRKSSEFGAEQ